MGSAAPEGLQDCSRFQLRRTIERLREGIYDPLAVRLLTAHREELEAKLRQDLLDVEAGAGAHLCVCGAYGQGKSHTLAFLQEAALQQGYAVSAINLDPREAPLHQFRQVYRALLQTLTFPAGGEGSAAHLSLIDAWNAWVRAQPLGSEDRASALAALLPVDMPHVFRAILVALVQPTLEIPLRQQHSATDRDFRPADIPWTLQRALQGEFIPAVHLRTALKFRQVFFYRDASLALHGDEPFLRMVLALPQLFHRMGYPGWVLLFDEGEAIAQVRRSMRARSYRILHRLLCPDSPHPGLYPVFAFTPDFFHRLQEEDYHLPDFDRDYAQAWRQLSAYQLRSLSRTAWQDLCDTLIALHAAAYGWHADREDLLPLLTAHLSTLPLQDPRSTFKALVDELDQVHQQAWFAQRSRGRE
ncbi:MAG: BREX system ATP-binding domain-containing protein [Candidatus Entotheonellia bacterium]